MEWWRIVQPWKWSVSDEDEDAWSPAACALGFGAAKGEGSAVFPRPRHPREALLPRNEPLPPLSPRASCLGIEADLIVSSGAERKMDVLTLKQLEFEW